MQETGPRSAEQPKISDELKDELLQFFSKQKVLRGYLTEVERALGNPVFKHIKTPKEELFILEILRLPEGQQLDLVFLPGDSTHPAHIHDNSPAYVKFFAGSGVAFVGDIEYPYSPEQLPSFIYPAKIGHGFEVSEPTFLVSLQKKPILTDEGMDFRYAK